MASAVVLKDIHLFFTPAQERRRLKDLTSILSLQLPESVVQTIIHAIDFSKPLCSNCGLTYNVSDFQLTQRIFFFLSV